MVKEVISRIREAEAEAEGIRKAAVQKAKEIETAANTSGRETLGKKKAEAAAEAAKLLEKAGAEADALVEEARQKAAREGEELTVRAAGRLDAAAELIVERIVGAK